MANLPPDDLKPNDNDDVTSFDQVDVDRLTPDSTRALPLLVSLSKVADFEPYRIAQRKLDIGRSDSSDIVINRPNVSRRHVTIYYDNLGQQEPPMCILEDRNSRNGTFLNRKPLKGQHILKDGDSILIGDCVIGYFLKTEAELRLERNLKDALARHGHKTDMRRITSNFPAQLDVLIPEETFTPKGISGYVRDINMGGLRFVTNDVSRSFWQQLLKEKRHIQCRIGIDDEENIELCGKVAWVHYDNRVVPETCAIGVEFSDLTAEAKKSLRKRVDKLEAS